ncbi:MAG: tetratricopeptide repeat protein, partial [bacterium]
TAAMQAEPLSFELSGQVKLPDGAIDPSVRPQIFLQSRDTIYYKRETASRGWTFRFKGLVSGKYTLFIIAQNLGTLKTTVLIGVSQADAEGRIQMTATLTPGNAGSAEVSALVLAVPKRATREYEKAVKCLGELDREGAVRHLEKAVELAPQFSDAWNRLGTIAFKEQVYSKAERYFREAIEQDPVSYPPLVNLGAALLLQNRLDDALKVNLEAVDRRPDDPLAHAQLGGAYFALGSLKLAESHLQSAKELEETHFSNPHLMLAKIYFQREDFSAVVEELEDFLRIHPDYPQQAKLEEAIKLAREKLRGSSGP